MLLLHISSARLPLRSFRCVGPALCLCEPQFRARTVVVGAQRANRKAGKKKKKKKGDTGEAAGSPASERRVGLHPTQISVRRQIQYVREYELSKKEPSVPQRKQANPKRSASASQERQSRQLADDRRQQQRLAEDHQVLRNPNQLHRSTIQSVYHTASFNRAPVVIVDGYNVLFLIRKMRAQSGKGGLALQAREAANSKAAKRCKQAGLMYSAGRDSGDEMSSVELETMRIEVERSVQAYASRKEFQAQVVWDSMGRAGEAADVTKEVRDEGFSVAYTAGMEADTHLSRSAREYVAQGAQYAQVVTSDVDAGTITDKNVVVVSSASFLDEMESYAREDTEDLAVLNAVSLGSFGGSFFDIPSVLKASHKDPEKGKQLEDLLNGRCSGVEGRRRPGKRKEEREEDKREEGDEGRTGSDD